MLPFRAALLCLLLATANGLPTQHYPLVGKPPNDFSCVSDHNPVVMLHGLSASDIVDLNQLQYYLNNLGFCTFSQTYGAHTLVPFIGGLTEMADSAVEIADFIRQVHTQTGGTKKVDLVGHSEGGVQTLYVPLTQSDIPSIIEHTVALGPAVHGAQYYGLTDVAYFLGNGTRDFIGDVIDVLGAPAINDMSTGGPVYEGFLAATGHIVQSGVKASIVMSRNDTLVAPTVSIVNEPGVRNLYVQDYCPQDTTGHAGLAWDSSVWGIIVNELTENYGQPVNCSATQIPV
ncbi:alpha/beta-hydrolase [Mycena galericulata]|nr:alpha/beta-hydrolase [Mycena galericulata]